jgi:hypothetical protein
MGRRGVSFVRQRLASAGVAVVAICAACGGGQSAEYSSVDSIEIDGNRLSLPRTELVACHAFGDGQYLLWW